MNRKIVFAVMGFLFVAAIFTALIGLNGMNRISDSETKSQFLVSVLCADEPQVRALALVKQMETIDQRLISGESDFQKNPDGNLVFVVRCDYNREQFIELKYPVYQR